MNKFMKTVGMLVYSDPKILPTFETKASENEHLSFCCQIVEEVRPKIPKGPSKDATVASKYRSEGNELFKKGDYKEALKLYTQSVAYTPNDDPKDKQMLALALANRSAALFYIKAYKQCLTEIDNTIQAGYPGGLQYKLHDRKGKCYLALNLPSPAKTAFKKAFSFLEITTLEKSKKDDFRQSLMKRLNDCDIDNGISNDVENRNPMNKVYTIPELEKTNSTHPSLTSACDVKYCPSKGRYFEANRDIEAGELILVEEPYVAALASENFLDHCHHCFKQALAPIVCRKCTFGLYCSNACRDISWESYHQYECAIDFSDDVSDTRTVSVYRMILISQNDLLLNYCKRRVSEDIEGANRELTGCNDDGLYIATDYNTVQHLLNHSNKLSKYNLFKYCLQAVYLMKVLETSTYFTTIPDIEIEEFKLYIVKELLYGLIMYEVNGINIFGRAYNGPDVNTTRGDGIYSTASLQNHACNHNTFNVYYGKHLIQRSWKPISKGQEITTTYTGHYTGVPKHERQQYLKQYHFECTCSACKNDWPILTDMEDDDLTFILECQPMMDESHEKLLSGDIAGALLRTLDIINLSDDFSMERPLQLQLLAQENVRDISHLMAYCYTYSEPVLDYFHGVLCQGVFIHILSLIKCS